ncbi:hypothetical protein CSA37_07520 [Candidatus Fermentibacteria bacterium]|nr:MAG: hypothetical protein CSA37_07520 [Candidatus Fermentibacteria bacterium]
MTEKVMSLSSGLVLGILFALSLGVGTTQLATSPMHMDYPEIPYLTGLNDLQSFHATPAAPSRDTTPAAAVTPPANTQGRIIRIATVTETVEPALSPTVSSGIEEPKSFSFTEEPKLDGTLQHTHLQHSCIARAGDYSARAELIQAARETNFTSIACGSASRSSQTTETGTERPSVIDDKPEVVRGASCISSDAHNGEENDDSVESELSNSSRNPEIHNNTDGRSCSVRINSRPDAESEFRNRETENRPDPSQPGHRQQGYWQGFD